METFRIHTDVDSGDNFWRGDKDEDIGEYLHFNAAQSQEGSIVVILEPGEMVDFDQLRKTWVCTMDFAKLEERTMVHLSTHTESDLYCIPSIPKLRYKKEAESLVEMKQRLGSDWAYCGPRHVALNKITSITEARGVERLLGQTWMFAHFEIHFQLMTEPVTYRVPIGRLPDGQHYRINQSHVDLIQQDFVRPLLKAWEESRGIYTLVRVEDNDGSR